MKKRVRKGELWSGENDIVVEKDIDVDEAVGIMAIDRFGGTPHATLDGLEREKQRKGLKGGGESNGCVAKMIRRGKMPWGTMIDRGDTKDLP